MDSYASRIIFNPHLKKPQYNQYKKKFVKPKSLKTGLIEKALTE